MDREFRVLLIEDNPDDAALTLRALATGCLGGRVTHVEDGAQAIDFLTKAEVNQLPRLALLDLKLPKVDGFEVLTRIRSDARTRALPVVIFTSSNEERDVALSYQFGVNSYVVKPVNFNEYMTVVGNIGRYWCALNKVPHEQL
jgi:two-component system, response regulator